MSNETSLGGTQKLFAECLHHHDHPSAATAVTQCVEPFEQLLVLDSARISLTHNIGGPSAASLATVSRRSRNDGD